MAPGAEPRGEQVMKDAFGRAAILKAAIFATASAYITFALGLLLSVLIARKLGPSAYGQYAYVVWLAGMLIMLGNHGLTGTGIKFISENMGRGDREKAMQVHGWLGRWQKLSLLLTALAACVFVPLAKPAGWDGHMVALLSLVIVSFGFKAWSLFNTAMAKGYGAFNIEAITNVTSTMFSAVLVLLLFLFDAPLMGYLAAFAATSIMYWACSAWLLRKEAIQASMQTPEPALLAKVRPHLWWTILLALVGAAGARTVEILLTNRWLGAADMGYLAVALGLSRGGTELLVAGLGAIIMPIMGYAFGSGDPAQVRRVFENSTRYYQFVGLILAGGGCFWSEALITLMYGERYVSAIPVLRIFVATSGSLLISGAASAILSNSDNQRFRVGVSVLSFMISAAMAFALIPRYGLIGAALASTASGWLCYAVTVVGIKVYTGLSIPWVDLARQYLAAGLATVPAAVVYQASDGWVQRWIPGIVYGLALLLFSLVVKVWRTDELEYLAGVARQRPRYLGWVQHVLRLAR